MITARLTVVALLLSVIMAPAHASTNKCCCVVNKKAENDNIVRLVKFTRAVKSCKVACKRGTLVGWNDKCDLPLPPATRLAKRYQADNGCPAGETLVKDGNNYSCNKDTQ